MRVVGIFWLIFSILFFGGGYLWQNKSAILAGVIKNKIEDKVKEIIPDELNHIIDIEKTLIEGGGLKYNPPAVKDLFEYNRDDRLLLDKLTLPTDEEEDGTVSPLEYILPENLKEKYRKVFPRARPEFEFPHFGPNTIFDDPMVGMLRLNQQFDAGPLVVSINGHWNNPTINIIPDYKFPVKVTYNGQKTEEGFNSYATLTYNEELYDDLYFTSSVLYGDDLGVNLGVKYKQGYVNIQQTEHLSINGGYQNEF